MERYFSCFSLCTGDFFPQHSIFIASLEISHHRHQRVHFPVLPCPAPALPFWPPCQQKETSWFVLSFSSLGPWSDFEWPPSLLGAIYHAELLFVHWVPSPNWTAWLASVREEVLSPPDTGYPRAGWYPGGFLWGEGEGVVEREICQGGTGRRGMEGDFDWNGEWINQLINEKKNPTVPWLSV